jgi:hypothetical protein
MGPREQAYVQVVKQLNAAAAQHRALDPVQAFGSACEQYEDKAPDTVMSSCWQLLGHILSVAAAQGIGPGKGADYIEALLQAR